MRNARSRWIIEKNGGRFIMRNRIIVGSSLVLILYSCGGGEAEKKAPEAQFQGGCFGSGANIAGAVQGIASGGLKPGKGGLLKALAGSFNPASQGIQCSGMGPAADAVPPGTSAVTTAQASAAEDLSNAGTDLKHSAELLCNGNSECIAAALGDTPTTDEKAAALSGATLPGDAKVTSGIETPGGPNSKAVVTPAGGSIRNGGGHAAGGAGAGGGGGGGGSFNPVAAHQPGSDPNAEYRNGGNMMGGADGSAGGGSGGVARSRKREPGSGSGAGGGGDSNPFAALLGGDGGDSANGDGKQNSGVQTYGQDSRDLASQIDPKGSADPADYFSMTNQFSNIFKIVEKRYRIKQSDWIRQSL